MSSNMNFSSLKYNSMKTCSFILLIRENITPDVFLHIRLAWAIKGEGQARSTGKVL